MFLVLLVGFVSGILLVVILDIVAIYYWLRFKPKEDPKLVVQRNNVCNPKQVAEYCQAEGATPSESCMFLNLVLAFLWREWRDTTKMKSYFIKKMNLEFQELLLNKAAGRLLQQICVKDFCLGESLPVVKQATVMKIQSRSPDQVAQELDLALEIEYSGGFLICLDVDFIFGKTAYMAVKLKSLKGRLRLQFTRIPCTHWSFSFYEDPEMDIEVESQFSGKNLNRLASLIESQIRRSIRRKHTLPRYKVRYKPFFQQPIPLDGKQEVFIHNSKVTVGNLDVEVIDCSRLPQLPINSQLYCVVSIDSLPWKEVMPVNSSLWPVHEAIMSRTLSGTIGVSIKKLTNDNTENQREVVVIDTISPKSPASGQDIQRGDVLLGVNDVDVDSLKQAVRLIKNGGDKLVFKLQRPPSIPVVNVESHDASDAESKEEEKTASTETQKTDLESSFNFDSVCLDSDDSDGEDFVNIVVQELEQQIAKNDENVRKILRKVSLSTRKGKQVKTGVNFKLEGEHPEEESDTLGEIEEKATCSDKDSPKLGDKRAANLREAEANQEFNLKPSQRTSSVRKLNSIGEKERPIVKEAGLNADNSKKHSDRLSITTKILHKRDHSIDLDSDSSESASETTNITDGDGGWDNISQHTLLSRDMDQHLMSQKTSLVTANADPIWNESYTFDIGKQHKFMNVCVWSKSDERNGKDILLGYTSVPLMEIALECLSTTSRKHIQSYFLTPSYNRSGVSRTNLRVLLPGLKPETCNGDITLGFCYKPSLQSCFLNEEELHEALAEYVDKNEALRDDQEDFTPDELNTSQMHDFMVTQFYFSTRCDYCQKKVWTKAAVQCRVCAMICHKKCINNAHSNTYCTRMGVRAKPPAWSTEDANQKKSNETVTKETAETKEKDLSGVKIPDVEDLRHGVRRTVSSPQLVRRKVVRHASNKEVNGIEHPLQRSTETKDMDSIATAAATAKEAGKELFSSLDKDNRKEKLEEMVQKLKNEIDEESANRTEFVTWLEQTTNPERRTKLQISMRKSEERHQALSLLMIQYCSALQECLDSMDQPMSNN